MEPSPKLNASALSEEGLAALVEEYQFDRTDEDADYVATLQGEALRDYQVQVVLRRRQQHHLDLKQFGTLEERKQRAEIRQMELRQRYPYNEAICQEFHQMAPDCRHFKKSWNELSDEAKRSIWECYYIPYQERKYLIEECQQNPS